MTNAERQRRYRQRRRGEQPDPAPRSRPPNRTITPSAAPALAMPAISMGTSFPGMSIPEVANAARDVYNDPDSKERVPALRVILLCQEMWDKRNPAGQPAEIRQIYEANADE